MERIDIIGGGIAGLALAASLDTARFDVTVRERRADLPVAGTILSIWKEAQAALEALGIFDQLDGISPHFSAMPIVRQDGKVWVTLPVEDALLVTRGELLRVLSDAVPPNVRRVVERVERMPHPSADLTVGADGVHSVVRAHVSPRAARARLTPYLAVRGVLAEPCPDEWVGEYWGRGVLFGASPHPEGTNWYTSFRSDLGPHGIDPAATLEHTLRQHRERAGEHPLAPAIEHVLTAAAPESTLVQRIWTTPPMRAFHRGRVVLIGDAAHAMNPNLGRGACESLLDAVALAELLNRDAIDDALAAYSRKRVRRTRRLQRMATVLMRVALADRAQPARDAMLDLVSRRQSRARSRSRQSPRAIEHETAME